jgi:hypothetical protein
MTDKKNKCSYCDNIISAAPGVKIYSVEVDLDGFLTGITEGKILPGAYLYCSPKCMFLRRDGTVTKRMSEFTSFLEINSCLDTEK